MNSEQEQRLLFTNARVFSPSGTWKTGWLLTEGRRIRLMAPGYAPDFPPGYVSQTIEAAGRNLLPGFIDVHAHGGVGVEAMDADVEGLREVARFYARHGVTAYLPTTWTASGEAITKALLAITEAQGRVPGGATILGAHLEGPYLNPRNAGAQDPEYIRSVEREEALEFLDAGVIRRVTLAPEFEESRWLVSECARRGIAVSAGHTSCSYEQMVEASGHGLQHVTHCFNAMGVLNHRQPGTVGAALGLPEISCELIADNVHVHPLVMKLLVDVKGRGGVILITDAIRWAGSKDGTYHLDHREVVVRDGAVRLPDGTLAGSTLTMNRALQNISKATGRDLAELWPMSSLNAARATGVSDTKGSLEVGKHADLVLLDEDFNVAMTVVEGEVVYSTVGAHISSPK
ncbi:MAG: N-acetylglucosamine-6-phosphate deacetylase [Chloroflexota bacterium]|nr:N-acetylglucosamine-6-phosphate deacetylase [Chloroflexota bacterium]MDQ5866627.1 N-acetylglucosamine-6-phosphate deacetylase [Chloroflexota bacterium]